MTAFVRISLNLPVDVLDALLATKNGSELVRECVRKALRSRSKLDFARRRRNSGLGRVRQTTLMLEAAQLAELDEKLPRGMRNGFIEAAIKRYAPIQLGSAS